MSNLFAINGRMRYLPRIEAVRHVGPGKWEVKHAGFDAPFRVEGGRHAGGTKRDWFVDHPTWNKSIACTSVVDAMRMLSGM